MSRTAGPRASRAARRMDYVDHRSRIRFPSPERANEWGMVAQGGNLSPGILLSAYEQGIFPWYEDPPIVWFSPDPRFVLYLEEFRVGKRLRRKARNTNWIVTCDRAFAEVIHACRTARLGREGTWITRDMERAYRGLHELGYTHSVELWDGHELVGGLYGVATGGMFAGESMFSRASDAGKLALIALVGLIHRLRVPMIDCQAYTDNLARFGAREIDRNRFLSELAALRSAAVIPDSWHGYDGNALLHEGLALDAENRRAGRTV